MAQEDVEPQVVNRDGFFVAGLKVRGKSEQEALKNLWAQFAERAEEFRDIAASGDAYGVMDNFDEASGEFDYLAGVEVSSPDGAAEDMEVWELKGDNYAVFNTSLSRLMETFDYAYQSWLPNSNYHRAPGPEFEFYGHDFDSDDPESPMQIYIPVLPHAGGE